MFTHTRFSILISIFFLWNIAFSFADDSDEWRTISDEITINLGSYSFEVHYKKQDRLFVNRVVDILIKDSPKVLEYFDYLPRDTIQFIVEESSLANGSATVFPTNIIRLYNVPPLNDQYLLSNEDWLQGLVLHELVHIIHMDQTRGFLNGLRTIFGSVGKLGGVVPRWFTEGIATWAETEFTTGGRLRHKVLEMELKYLVMNDNFCNSIDCLDEPGIYPHGRNSYWMGSYFLNFLEKKKPGTIKCLIVANSDSIPFFLNSAFKECVGQSAPKVFQSFRNQWRKNIFAEEQALQQKNIFKGLKKVAINKFGPIDWQKGFFVRDGKFWFHVLEDKIPLVVKYDLESGKQDESRFDEIIYRYGEGTKAAHILALSTLERSGQEYKTRWKLWNTKKNKVRNIKNSTDVEHFFLLENNKKLFANYKKSRWGFYLDKIESDSKPVFEFPEMYNLTLFKTFFHSGKSYVLIRAQKKVLNQVKEEILIYDPRANSLSKAFHSKTPLAFIGQCENNFVFKGNDYISLALSNNSSVQGRLDSKLWSNIAAYRGDKKHQLV